MHRGNYLMSIPSGNFQNLEPEALAHVNLPPSRGTNIFIMLLVAWDDVIGEPETIRSPECAWRLSNHCFQFSKDCCYIFLSILCAPITACCLGCTFACIAFEHIWCVNPCLRCWKISCAATRTFVMAWAQAVIVPIADALGKFWASIKVKTQTLPEATEKEKDVLLV